jgi:hypothetical protein
MVLYIATIKSLQLISKGSVMKKSSLVMALLLGTTLFSMTAFGRELDLTKRRSDQYVNMDCQTIGGSHLILKYGAFIIEAKLDDSIVSTEFIAGYGQAFILKIQGTTYRGDFEKQAVYQTNRTNTQTKKIDCEFSLEKLKEL